jgi:hypothetical protein
VVSDGDAAELFGQAQRGGKVTMQSVEAMFRPTEEFVLPRTPGWIPGSAGMHAAGATPHAGGGEGSLLDTHDAAVRKICDKLSASVLGNSHRLRRAFRKYDVDGNGQVAHVHSVLTFMSFMCTSCQF